MCRKKGHVIMMIPGKEQTMIIKQIARYTALIKRRSELLLCSGISWKPEYEKELQGIDKELTELRKELEL